MTNPIETTVPRRRLLFWLAIALFLVTRLVILLVVRPFYSDIPLYFLYAVRGIDHGETPYRQIEIEYPPVAWWAMAAPRLLQEDRIPPEAPRDATQVSMRRYAGMFRLLHVLPDAIAFALFLAILKLRRPAWRDGFACVYVAATAILGYLLYDRLDTILLCLFLAWAYCWLRGAEGDAAGWRLAAYAILGMSISFKVIPVIVAPFLLLAELQSSRRVRNTASGLATLAAATLLPFVLHYPSAGWSSFGFIHFHAGRGLQIESLYASLILPLRNFGLSLHVEHSIGGWYAVGDGVAALGKGATIVLFGFLAATGLWALLLGRRYDRSTAFAFSCLALVGAVVFSKVISPQYFIWALPLLILLGAEVLPNCRRDATRPVTVSPLGPWLLATSVIVIALMTTWIFPLHYFSHAGPKEAMVELDPHGLIPALSPLACGMLLGRNLLYLGAVVWLGRRLWTGHGGPVLRRLCETASG